MDQGGSLRRRGKGSRRIPPDKEPTKMAREIADRSMELAGEFLDQTRDEVLAMADGNVEVLREAAEIVRARATGGPALSHSAEHLAFSLITAAHTVILHGSDAPKHTEQS